MTTMFKKFLPIILGRENELAVTNERSQAKYGELLQQAESLRPLLAGEKGKQTVILLALPSGPEFTAVLLAAFAAGALVATIPDKSTTHETRNYLRRIQPDLVVLDSLRTGRAISEALTRPTAILTLTRPENEKREEGTEKYSFEGDVILSWPEIMDAPNGIEPIKPGNYSFPPDTALIQFTSGSTGIPKGILITQDNLRACLEYSQDFLAGFEGQHVFCPIPQFHAFGGAVVLEHLFSGSPVHLTNRFLPGGDLARMQEHRCASILAAPAYFKLLLRLNMLKPELLPNLTSVTIGTASADQSLISDLQKQMPDLTIHLRYGLTETVGTLSRLSIKPDEMLSSPGLVGKPISEKWEVRSGKSFSQDGIYEGAGEIRVKSRIVAAGQLVGQGGWKPLTDEDGFFSTGDLGYLDTEGQLHLRGRISTFIKRNGFRIDPFEIEALVRDMPGIREAVAVGQPDPLSGQQIVVFAETEPGAEAPDSKAIMKFCMNNLSPHKVPQRIVLRDALPRTPSGKPDRKGLGDF